MIVEGSLICPDFIPESREVLKDVFPSWCTVSVTGVRMIFGVIVVGSKAEESEVTEHDVCGRWLYILPQVWFGAENQSVMEPRYHTTNLRWDHPFDYLVEGQSLIWCPLESGYCCSM